MLVEIALALFAVVLSGLFIAGHIAPVAPGLYCVMSAVAFFVYWADKRAAQHGRQRIRERTLHLLALLGGWPGAYAAQRILRHKTARAAFQRIFAVTVLLNILSLAFFLSRCSAVPVVP